MTDPRKQCEEEAAKLCGLNHAENVSVCWNCRNIADALEHHAKKAEEAEKENEQIKIALELNKQSLVLNQKTIDKLKNDLARYQDVSSIVGKIRMANSPDDVVEVVKMKNEISSITQRLEAAEKRIEVLEAMERQVMDLSHPNFRELREKLESAQKEIARLKEEKV